MMRNSLARSLLTWRIHDMWLCEKPWMNRISGPFGLPHSCAEMVRPSGVFTLIGLYFRFCAKLDDDIASKAAATLTATRPHVRTGVMEAPPYDYRLSGRRSVTPMVRRRNMDSAAPPFRA